jgi:uncharacterized protein (DUF983 family)
MTTPVSANDAAAEDPAPTPLPVPRPTAGTLVSRALQLRCPRCGRGRLFTGWFRMPERCSECRLKIDRAPGYYLGSIYINYGATAVILLIGYLVLHDGFGLTNQQLAKPLVAICVLFPLWAFRYARALWLAFDCHFDESILRGEED